MSCSMLPPPDLDPVEVEETERVACPECGCVSERVVGEPFGCSETGVSCLTLDAAGVPDEARELATTWMPPVLFGGAL